jgi:hypothetical protein
MVELGTAERTSSISVTIMVIGKWSENRFCGRSCIVGDQDHPIDPADSRGAGHVSVTVATIIKGLVSCADRVRRATTLR